MERKNCELLIKYRKKKIKISRSISVPVNSIGSKRNQNSKEKWPKQPTGQYIIISLNLA